MLPILHVYYVIWLTVSAGPVVRITPDEVHLSNPEHYDSIYHVGTRYSKDARFYGAFGNPNSAFTTPSNNLHRIRRSGLNTFFSRQQLYDLQTRMHSSDSYTKTRPNILTALMDDSHDTKPQDKPCDVHDETYTVLSAAADTTGNAMTTTLRHVVSDPTIYSLLHKELVAAFPNKEAALPFAILERLPYLVSSCTRTSGCGLHTPQTGVIKEGLRLSFGVPGRPPRVVPAGGALFDSHVIPAGMMHQDEHAFPDHTRFDPGRWSNDRKTKIMESAFVPFGKGSRACVGIKWLYVTIGTIVRRFDKLQGNELVAEDLIYEDYFSSYNPIAAKKFHVCKEAKTLVD
ncbi:hypothetical protein D6D01_07526 [Aureobasidium pullulans]|uniref:Cytochrome P450 n=1 Tax=Aureobasidium pullulans TaxID=5580 RepID=A0A4S9KNE2_AURPU|nr:hypothetical protein D6D01_07526 [Aureobasidium pullulans]